MIVGGTLGGVRMFWALYSQIRSRRLELLSVPAESPHISPMQLVSITLTCFLTGWFILGETIKYISITIYMYKTINDFRLLILYTHIRFLTVLSIMLFLARYLIVSLSLSISLILSRFDSGNYWILKIRWPDYEAKMFDPDHWCHKTLYTFAIVHLGIMYTAIGMSIITAIGLAICRVLACPWFER